MEPKEKRAFEPTGLVPRSIVRTFERFRQQLLPGSEGAAIREYRISRYQVLVSTRCLFTLLTIPIATNWLVSSWLLSPIIEHFWNTQQNEIFLNAYQEERAFTEMESFSEKLFFESLLVNDTIAIDNNLQSLSCPLADLSSAPRVTAGYSVPHSLLSAPPIAMEPVRVVKTSVTEVKATEQCQLPTDFRLSLQSARLITPLTASTLAERVKPESGFVPINCCAIDINVCGATLPDKEADSKDKTADKGGVEVSTQLIDINCKDTYIDYHRDRRSQIDFINNTSTLLPPSTSMQSMDFINNTSAPWRNTQNKGFYSPLELLSGFARFTPIVVNACAPSAQLEHAELQQSAPPSGSLLAKQVPDRVSPSLLQNKEVTGVSKWNSSGSDGAINIVSMHYTLPFGTEQKSNDKSIDQLRKVNNLSMTPSLDKSMGWNLLVPTPSSGGLSKERSRPHGVTESMESTKFSTKPSGSGELVSHTHGAQDLPINKSLLAMSTPVQSAALQPSYSARVASIAKTKHASSCTFNAHPVVATSAAVSTPVQSAQPSGHAKLLIARTKHALATHWVATQTQAEDKSMEPMELTELEIRHHAALGVPSMMHTLQGAKPFSQASVTYGVDGVVKANKCASAQRATLHSQSTDVKPGTLELKTATQLMIKQRVQDKILELAVYYNQQTISSITNVAGDLISALTLACLFLWMKPEISILKSFLVEAIYSLSDTTKSFLLILLTDLLVGFHSPRGWETALEVLLKHFGLPENQDFVFLFVATFPVLLDTVFKYWIFRHLNKISPSTVATYHSMIE